MEFVWRVLKIACIRPDVRTGILISRQIDARHTCTCASVWVACTCSTYTFFALISFCSFSPSWVCCDWIDCHSCLSVLISPVFDKTSLCAPCTCCKKKSVCGVVRICSNLCWISSSDNPEQDIVIQLPVKVFSLLIRPCSCDSSFWSSSFYAQHAARARWDEIAKQCRDRKI